MLRERFESVTLSIDTVFASPPDWRGHVMPTFDSYLAGGLAELVGAEVTVFADSPAKFGPTPGKALHLRATKPRRAWPTSGTACPYSGTSFKLTST